MMPSFANLMTTAQALEKVREAQSVMLCMSFSARNDKKYDFSHSLSVPYPTPISLLRHSFFFPVRSYFSHYFLFASLSFDNDCTIQNVYFNPLNPKIRIEILICCPLHISYRSNRETVKYQAISSCMVVSSILITTLFFKLLILKGEI